MIKKIILLFILNVKGVIRKTPHIIAGTAVFAITAILLCYGFMVYENDRSDSSFTRAGIGIISDDDNTYTDMAISYFSSMKGIKDIFNAEIMEQDEAVKALKDNNIDAVLYLPNDFLASVIDGTNIPAHIILNDSGTNSESILIRTFVDAAAGDLATAQAGIYTVDYAARLAGINGTDFNKINTEINYEFIKYFLNRTSLFNTTYTLSTGNLSISEYYFCSALVLILTLSGITCVSLLKCPPDAVHTALRREGLTSVVMPAFQVLSCTIIYTMLIAVILFLIKPDIRINFILRLSAIALTSFSMNMFVYRLCRNETTGMILIFILAVIMLYMAGGFIPSAFLPKQIYRIGKFLPSGIMLNTVKSGSITACIIYSSAFIALSGILERNR